MSLQARCFQIEYDVIMDREKTYENIRILSMKNNRSNIPPLVQVINYKGKCFALIEYDKTVTIKNLSKFNIDDNVGKLSTVFVRDIHSTRASFKKMDKDIFPPETTLEFSFDTQEQSSDVGESVKISPENVQCKECGNKVPFKSYNADKSMCKKCYRLGSKREDLKDVARRQAQELDPSGTLEKFMDNYMIYNEKNLIVNSMIETINIIRDTQLQMAKKLSILIKNSTLDNVVFPTANEELKIPKKYAYVIWLGNASRLINECNVFRTSRQSPSSEHNIVKVGITDNIEKVINECDSYVRFSYETEDKSDNVKCLMSKHFDEDFVRLFDITVLQYTIRNSVIIPDLRLSANSSKDISKSIFVVNNHNMSLIVEYIKNL